MATAACLARAPSASVEALGELLLASTSRDNHSPGGRSALNNDGSWLQLCLSTDPKGWRARLLADPAASEPDPVRRLKAARTALRRLLELRDAGTLRGICERTLALTLPRAPDVLQRSENGVFWIAADLDAPGTALYVDAGPAGERGGWQVAWDWLADILAESSSAHRVIDRLSAHARTASFGIEGTAAENARAKLYFRLKRPASLADLGVELFVVPAVTRFLNMAMTDFAVELEGLVLCVGFDVSSGDLVDAKVDLCGHCLRYSKDGWERLVGRCTDEFGLAPLPVTEALAPDREVAFIGFGVDRRGGCRLNLYLKSAPPVGPAEPGEIRAAIADAVDYLRSLQSQAGAWSDYELPVGASDQWITAYVGLALADVEDQPDGEAARASERAADWLVNHRTYEAGWGYNAITGPDTDSTAFAVALLDRLGRGASPADRAFLRSRWRASGGFATYEGPRAWGAAHPDVTPQAFLGLSEADRVELYPVLRDYTRRIRLANGLWPSYWWRRPFYATYVTLLALQDLGVGESWLPPPARNERFEISNAFDLACVIGIENLRNAPEERLLGLVRRLLDMQQAGGGWPGSDSLRVTEDTCYEPWRAPDGACYRDRLGTISTATAIRALSQVLARCRDRPPGQRLPAMIAVSGPASP